MEVEGLTPITTQEMYFSLQTHPKEHNWYFQCHWLFNDAASTIKFRSRRTRCEDDHEM